MKETEKKKWIDDEPTSQIYTIAVEMMDTNEMGLFHSTHSTQKVDDVKSPHFSSFAFH